MVFRNYQWGAEKRNSTLWYDDNFVGTELDTQVSYAGIAKACGLQGVVARTMDELREALTKAIADQKAGKTTLIEAMINQELGEPFRRDAMKKPVEVAGISAADMRKQKQRMTLPFEMGAGAAAYMAAAILLSAFVRGYSGFGFSALVISASGLVTNPLHFVAVVVLCEALMSVQAWRGIGAFVDWRRVWLLLAGAAVGMPLGLWALTSISEDAARAVISGYVLVMCLILLAAGSCGGKCAGRGIFWPASLLAGECAGDGGLPVVAQFFAAQTMQANVFRATLVAYFPLLDIYSAPLYFYSGLVSWDTLWASMLALPMVFFGQLAGQPAFPEYRPAGFSQVCHRVAGNSCHAGSAEIGAVNADGGECGGRRRSSWRCLTPGWRR